MNKMLAYILAIGILLGVGTWWHQRQVSNMRAEIVQQIANDYNSRLIQLQDKADESTLDLLKQIEEIKGEKILEIDAINKRHDDIVASLQNRPDRRTSSSNNTGSTADSKSPEGATGLQLSRPDGEFLVWFSRNTAQLQSELKACYKQYDEVKDAIDKFKRENPTRFVNPVDGTTGASSSGINPS